MGNAGEQPVRSCIKKLKKNISKDVQVRFGATYNTVKLNLFINTKDPITKLAFSFVVYHFRCPRGYHDYIEKTGKTLWERINMATVIKTA